MGLKEVKKGLTGIFAAIACLPVVCHASPPEEGQASCAPTADNAAMQRNVPNLAADLRELRKLPLVGRSVHDFVTDPSQGIKSCQAVLEGSLGNYNAYTKTLEVDLLKGDDLTSDHEYFHATQPHDFSGLTALDTAMAGMLSEATAVAYELMVLGEAKHLKGWNYRLAEDILNSRGASLDNDVSEVFNAAYKRHAQPTRQRFWRDGNGDWVYGIPPDPRALQEAGREVVRYLMQGNNADWTEGYSVRALEVARLLNWVATELSDKPEVSSSDSAYQEKRDKLFQALGNVSSNIQIIPPEFLGPNANQTIEELKDKIFPGKFQLSPSSTKVAAIKAQKPLLD